MFGKKKKKVVVEEEVLDFETKDYIMPKRLNADSLVVANLESITNRTRIPMVETTNQVYIFEVIKDEETERYREVFTGFLAQKEGNTNYFHLPYVVNVKPLKEVAPEVIDEIPKYSLLLLLDRINNPPKKKERKPNSNQSNQ